MSIVFRDGRTGWVTQLVHVLDDDGSGTEFDRYLCHWQGLGPDGWRTRFGPPGVRLTEALAWCSEHACRTFVDAFDGQRWLAEQPSHGHPALPSIPPVAPQSWSRHARSAWEVDVSLDLGLRDYDDAAPRFERALRAGAYDVRHVHCEDIAARLHATLVVAAPTRVLAGAVAADEVRRAATDHPDGLRDEQGEGLRVTGT